LLSTIDRFNLTFTLSLLSNAGRSGGCKESEDRHQREQRNERVTFLTSSR
jgi:hypothetical protein